MQALFPLIGLMLIAVVACDVFMTVLNPAEYGGPMARRLNRLVWAGALRIGGGGERARGDIDAVYRRLLEHSRFPPPDRARGRTEVAAG